MAGPAEHEPSNLDEKHPASATTSRSPARRDQVPGDEESIAENSPCIPLEVVNALWKIIVVGLFLAIFFVLIDPETWASRQPSGEPEFRFNSPDNSPIYVNSSGKLQGWFQLTRRHAPPAGGNTSTLGLQAFSVDVPLLGLGGRVVGAGTPAGFEGIVTNLGDDTAGSGCQVTLGENVFGNSFGKPFVGNYTPPPCIGNSNSAVMNLTVTSRGRQFDRLAIV